MISSILSRLVILLFGTLYPAYSSYKAVRTKNVKEYVKWMMYWIVFALFTCAETITDIFLSFWFPFYYEFKIILVVYLLSPATNGSSILYRKFVHPVLTKKEQEIDECIAKAMENGYHTMLNLGSKSVAYATSVIMQTAIKGGGGLVNHIRKSYSLDDITTEETRSRKWNKDEADSGQEEERQKYRRRKAYSPRRTASSVSPGDISYPELDEYKRSSLPIDHDILRNVRSSEDISSGFSSAETLYNGAKYGSREHLPRTNSIGSTIRTRSRLAKKSNPEDESGCSTTEPDESQYEADEDSPFPFLIRGQSGNFLAPFVKPEYRYLFANLTEQQICNIGSPIPAMEEVRVEPAPAPAPSTVLQCILTSPGEGEKGPRNGKHKKNPAPLPPNQRPRADDSEEETGFSTPDSSPVLARKEGVPEIVECGNEDVREPMVEPMVEPVVEPVVEPLVEPLAEPASEPLTESKSEKKGKKGKGKTGESQISKMLHLSKIQIPFWGHKTGKHSPDSSSVSSMSRNSSHVSLSSKGEQECCISLKDYEDDVKTEPETLVGVREMSQSPSSKRRSIV